MPEVLGRLLPQSIQSVIAPLLSPGVLIALAVLSIVTFVASLVGVPFFLSRLPADYFSRRERTRLSLAFDRRSGLRIVLRILKNLLGLILLILGVIMLVLPGQALLTIFVALFLLDFPGKPRFERWLITRRPVLRAINGLRRRAGRAPIELRTSWLPPPRSSTPPPRAG